MLGRRCGFLLGECAWASRGSPPPQCSPEPARRTPTAAIGLIALDPSDPAHIVVRATYGVLSTWDGGVTWDWICEQAVGFSDNEDPMIMLTQNGTLIAGVFKGLAVSTDKGCGWSFVGGDLTDRYVVDLSTEKAAPERAVAIVSNGVGGGKFKTQVFETSDNGSVWTQAGVNLPEEFLGLTIDSAPSDPQRLYASGRYGKPLYPGTIERSDDRGATWQRFDIPGADDMHPPYLSAIDPSDPDVLYVRLDGAGADLLMMSKNGGETWEKVFEGKAGLLGFALSPDGTKVAVGGDKDGLWLAPADTLAFTKVSDLGVRCLTWSGDSLFACADEFKDGFQIGVSMNEGKTFSPLEHLNEVCPRACSSDSTVGQECSVQWGAVALTIDAKSCGGEEPDAGATTSSGSTSGASTSGGGVPGGNGYLLCSYGMAGDGAAGGVALLAAAAMSAAMRRRRRRQ
jgi:photosystem II stability/assembly factor-like uncharacterized protein